MKDEKIVLNFAGVAFETLSSRILSRGSVREHMVKPYGEANEASIIGELTSNQGLCFTETYDILFSSATYAFV